MASTITLQNSVDWARPFIRFAPLTIGVNNEPALSAANITKQIMLGAPFCWRWNRSAGTPFATVLGTQDYNQSISTFGFLEKVILTDATPSPNVVTEVPNIRNILGTAFTRGRPDNVSPVIDNNAGTITIRFVPVPDKVYTVNYLFQRKATLFSVLSDNWNPIPDEFSFVYNQGFLAWSLYYMDDPRFGTELQRFLGSLIAVSDGLDQTQKDIFIENWLLVSGQAVSRQQKVQIGSASRVA